MVKRTNLSTFWAKSFQRAAVAVARTNLRAGRKAVGQVVDQAVRSVRRRHEPPPGSGEWLSGSVIGPAGLRRYRLFKPAGVARSERLPLMVMLHGCGQDANAFARSTRMNRIAARQRFLVLYPEQDRRANVQGCWNWYETDSRLAFREVATLKQAIDQVCLFYPADRNRVALAGLSAGASMAALLATRYPESFRAIVMHSGIPPGSAHSSVSAIRAMRGRRAPTARLAALAGTAPLLRDPGATSGAGHAGNAPPSQAAWPPLLVIHGTADPVVAASNAAVAARMWADAAGARGTQSRLVRRGSRYAMNVIRYRCRGAAVATLCEVDGLGHAWSGGDDGHPFGDRQGPDASRMIWTFAQRQFRTASQPLTRAPSARPPYR